VGSDHRSLSPRPKTENANTQIVLKNNIRADPAVVQRGRQLRSNQVCAKAFGELFLPAAIAAFDADRDLEFVFYFEDDARFKGGSPAKMERPSVAKLIG
jgi:hypothetical protein